MVGKFHGDDVNADSGDVWFGLYPCEDTYQLKSTIIAVELIHDAVSDVPSEKTGKRVTVDQPIEPLFLIRGLSALEEGSVETVFYGRKFLFPGETWALRFRDDDYYHFTAFGNAVDRGEIPGRTERSILNHRLKYSQRPWKVTQEIASFEILDLDNPLTIYWVGDLDRDGRLDFLTDLANSYVSNYYTLFVSSLAKDDSFVQKAAFFQRSGC